MDEETAAAVRKYVEEQGDAVPLHPWEWTDLETFHRGIPYISIGGDFLYHLWRSDPVNKQIDYLTFVREWDPK